MAKTKSKTNEPRSTATTNEPDSIYREAVLMYLTEHKRWQKDKLRGGVDEQFIGVIEDMFDVFDSADDIPDEDLDLDQAVKALNEQWQIYMSDRDARGSQHPHNAMWKAHEYLALVYEGKHRQKKIYPPLGDIATMHKNGVPVAQIAKIYGFVTEEGIRLTDMVTQELENPGCIIKTPGAFFGGDWEDPRIVRDRKQENERLEAVRAVRQRRDSQKKRPSPKHELTPRDYYQQQTPVKQAAKYLQMTEIEVQNLFDSFQAEDELAAAEA